MDSNFKNVKDEEDIVKHCYIVVDDENDQKLIYAAEPDKELAMTAINTEDESDDSDHSNP